ncbi:MAG: hypothetical protein HY319_07755 [Armatimonadetes bacterium]|nr:hypothetical protein [Armatimonadota bacterium]
MSDLERELEAACRAQERQKQKLEQSLDELRQTGVQGNRAGTMVFRVVAAVAALVFLVISGIMLGDPAARVWYPLVLFIAVTSGVWVYFRRQRGE